MIELKEVPLTDVLVNGLFLWMGRMYAVTKPYDGEYCWAKEIAAGWTNNPDSRWQVSNGREENFNPCCFVQTLKYQPRY